MAIDYNAGITSLDTGASDITYSGNQGPKSPDQERQMAFDDTPGFELRSLEELLDEFRQDNNGRDPTSIDDLRRHFYIKYGPQGIAKIDKAVQQAEQQAQMQQREGIQMASAADPMLEEQYQQYVFEMQEQGMQPMSLEEFRQQAVAGMATGGRAGYRFGGHPGASHEGEGSGQTHGGTASGSPHAPGGGGDPQGKQSISVGYGQGKVDPGLAAAAGIGPAAAGFAGTTNVGEGGGPADFPLGDFPNAGEGPITYGQNEYQNLIVPGLLDKQKKFLAIQAQKNKPYFVEGVGWVDPSTEESVADPNINPEWAGLATQIGYVPKYAKPSGQYSDSIAKLGYEKAIEEGVGPKEFETWLKGEDGSIFKKLHSDYADKLSKELQISEWDKIYPSKNLNVKGRNTEEKQREALNTLMGEVGAAKALGGNEIGIKSDLTTNYIKNKDKYDDLGITNLEDYKEFINKAIDLKKGGIARLGYASGQLVKPGPGRPGYAGPGGHEETYEAGKSYERAARMSPGRSTAQFGHAGHAGKTESQAKAHQASGIDTPGDEPSGVGVTPTGTLPPVVDEKAEAEKEKFKLPSLWGLGIEAARKFAAWNNMKQRQNFLKQLKVGPGGLGDIDLYDEDYLLSSEGLAKLNELGYQDYLNRFKQPGGGGGGGDGPQPIIYPYQTASASVPGTDTPVDIDPVTGFPTEPIRFASSPSSVHDFTGIYGQRTIPMAADGGRIGYAGGGIADLRQGYFLGKLVKKAGRALKKVAKSPIGRMGLMALGGWGLNQLKPGFFNEGIFGKKGFLAPFLRKKVEGGFGDYSLAKLGILGMSAYPIVASMGKEEDEDFTDTDLYKSWLARKQGWDQTFAPVGDPANFQRMRLYADGGRIGYDSGGDVMMASYDYNDAMAESFEAYQKAIKDGIIPPTMEFDEYLELMQGRKEIAPQGIQMAAQGGRIGYAEGGDDEEDHRSAALSAMYGLRKNAQEGGLMDMGGMEKDYRNEGGFVPIGGQERADDVPARLSKNEFVFTADAVRNAGGGDIDKGAEIMENLMENLEKGGKVSEESQGLEGARNMFATSQRLEGVL